jgi:Bacterial membrane protein YfhO
MNKINFKEHGFALLIIVISIAIFCLPILQGKVLNSHDTVSWNYMSQESKVVSDAQGGNAWWTNAQFGGLPSYTTYGTNTGNYFGDLLFGFFGKVIERPMFAYLLSGIGFYLLSCALGFGLWIRLFGTIAFVYSSYNPILAIAGHDTKLLAIGCSAGVLAGIFFMLNNKRWIGLGVYAIFFAFLFTSGHYQVIYYLLIMLAIMAIFVLVDANKKGSMKNALITFGLIGIVSVIGALPAMQQVLLIRDYTKATMRGGQSELTINKAGKKPTGGLDIEYAFRWSQGIGETFSLLVPNVHGPIGHEAYADGATADKLSELGMQASVAQQLPDYWGPQPFISGPVYFGAMVILLFIFGLFTVQSHHKWWIVISSIIFVVLSWGKNFEGINTWLFNHLPMYNKFRTPSMALIIPQIVFPILGIWGIHELVSGKVSKEQGMKALKISGGITVALVLIGGVFSSMWQNFKGANYAQLMDSLTKSFGGPQKANELFSAMKTDMASAVQQDGIRSLVFVIIGIALLWAYLKNYTNIMVTMGIFTAVLFADLYTLHTRYIRGEGYQAEAQTYLDKEEYQTIMFGARPVDNEILADKDPYYRVHDLTTDPFNDAQPAYFHKMVGGYHPAKMEIYQDLIDMQIGKNNSAVLNMLNTKYFIVPGQNNAPRKMQNPNACGNAWFVNEVKFVKTADEEMLALNAPSMAGDTTMKGTFNPLQTAFVRDAFKESVSKTTFVKDSSANIKLTKYGLNDLEFSSTNAQEGFAVFSDIYYDGGWKCYIDGKETKIIKANYVLRGAMVPAGQHKIEFHFVPNNAILGRNLAKAGSILCLLIFGFGLWNAFKKGDQSEVNAIEAKA